MRTLLAISILVSSAQAFAGLPNSFVAAKSFLCIPLRATTVFDVTSDTPPDAKKLSEKESLERAVELAFKGGSWINIFRKDSRMNLSSSGAWNILHADNGSSILKVLGMSSDGKSEVYEYVELLHQSANALVNHGFCFPPKSSKP